MHKPFRNKKYLTLRIRSMLATFQNKGNQKRIVVFLMRWKASTPAVESFYFEKKRVPKIARLVRSTKMY